MLKSWDDLRPEVQKFALAMEAKLRENDYKGGWKNDSASALVTRLKEETEELEDAVIAVFNKRTVLGEAADVANFAMMVADVKGEL